MKKEMKSNIKHIITRIILSIFSLTIISCRQSSDHITDPGTETGPASVKINLQGSDYNDGEMSKTAGINGINSTTVQTEEISFNNNNDYKLVATLTPESSSNPRVKTGITVINPLPDGIRYNVAVFDNNGNYVTERTYSTGSESSMPAITGLNGGSTYTFIVYSIGTQTGLPAITFADPGNKTLATATVNNVSGDNDLMYFSKTMTLTGNNTNYLDVVLQHKYSQITVSLDATSTSYNITAISGVTIAPHTGNASIQLSNGNTATTGTIVSRNITFSSPNSNIITATPVLVNANNTTNGTFSIGSITMTTTVGNSGAQMSQQNLSFNNLKIARGVKYNLKLTFEPNDGYLTHQGYSAAKINGMIWMRHNLGATLSADPDIPSQDINGNYYQWGRSRVVATATTSADPITGWDNTTIPSDNAWNSNKEQIPVKTSTDPCPTGWRVPTGKEYSALYNNTTKTDIGTSSESSTNFSRASVLTSKHDSNVKLTFLASGYRDEANGALFQRGLNSHYWNNVPDTSNQAWHARINAITFYSANRSRATPVRCIAEYPY
ncbi:TPA: FISUMP domain-containing protein [Elizabethkingia anophelis]